MRTWSYIEVLEAVSDMGDGTVRESWARYSRDYPSEYWYTFRETEPRKQTNGATRAPKKKGAKRAK